MNRFLGAAGLDDEHLERARTLREDLHAHPELSLQERRTQRRIAEDLVALGLKPRVVAETGLVADLAASPVLCLRADIDALPITEATGVSFSSTVPGVAHACGHDVHASALIGATSILVRDSPAIRVLFQPAEERGIGARRCVADGACDGIAAVFGGHLDLDYPVGTVALQAGPMCASTDQFTITVRGRASHAARPHKGVDAILCGARIVDALQGIVAREVEPGQPAVITVGVFRAGERSNILAGEATLQGTIRSGSPEVRVQLRSAVPRVCAGIAAACGAEVQFTLEPGHDPVVNDAALVDAVVAAFRASGIHVVRLARANTGGEDFSDLLVGRRGVYLRWGASGAGARTDPAHSGGFLPDPRVLDVAVAGYVAAARALLAELGR